MGWEVPESDERRARRLLFPAIHEAFAQLEAEKSRTGVDTSDRTEREKA
jgi:hypothetical protein